MSDLEPGQVFCDKCHCKEFNLLQIGDELVIRCVSCQKKISLSDNGEGIEIRER